MVTTGFSKPYVAKYTTTPGTAANTYTGGILLGRGVEVSMEIDAADDNNFYADNVIAESAAAQFTSAEATVTIDGLEPEAATLILGLPAPTAFKVSEEVNVQMQAYGGTIDPPYVGFAYIRRTMMNGKTGFWPVIHPKVRFGLPSDSAATQEDQIDWQTQELSTTVLRDDTAKANWKLTTAEPLATEAEAEAVIKKYFNIADALTLKAASAPAEEGAK